MPYHSLFTATEGNGVGIWIELGVFVLALAWGLWQLHDVKKARAKSRAEKDELQPGQK